MEVATFTCSICGEPSQKICVYCTLDACENHLCARCLRCSDCCQCDVRRLSYDKITVHEANGHVTGGAGTEEIASTAGNQSAV
jgi:transcription elongation factor Elf1